VLKAEPDCSYDLIVTDPPYGVNIHNAGAQRDKWGEEVFDDDTESTMSLMKKVFPEMYRVLKPDTHAYVFFAMTYYAEFKKMLEDAGFDVVPTPIIWNKTSQSAPPVTPYSFTQAYEPIFLCHKGRRSLNAYIPNVISMDRVSSSQTIHVTQKPTQLMKKLIEASSAAGDLVLDPFCGSGSTIIAAYESKRRVKGIEKDSDMCAKVLLRIKDFSGGVVRGVEPADGGTPTPAVTELVNEF
jgi:DNA modification methylase